MSLIDVMPSWTTFRLVGAEATVCVRKSTLQFSCLMEGNDGSITTYKLDTSSG